MLILFLSLCRLPAFFPRVFPGKVLAFVLVDSPRLGRKSTIPYFFLFTSVCAVIVLCLPLDYRTHVALAGKMGVTAAFASIYVYSSELFPTIFRNVALGICSSSARVGSMLAPQVVVLFREPYTTLVFGAVSFLAFVTLLVVRNNPACACASFSLSPCLYASYRVLFLVP